MNKDIIGDVIVIIYSFIICIRNFNYNLKESYVLIIIVLIVNK